MKIKVKKTSYNKLREEYLANKKKHKKPVKPSILFRTLMRLISIPDLLSTHFKCEKINMDKIEKGEPAFYLMNHSSFIDLEIAASVLYPKPFNIVATTDAFLGKNWLMRKIGCIPTKKFVADATMVRDIIHTIKKIKSNVIMFPEAGYTFDGTMTTMADNLGKCTKMLGAPLVTIITHGAFSRDPLYNNLQRRKVKVSATMECLLSREEVAAMPEEEISKLIMEKFAFDGFKWQIENKIRIPEPFRADGLERVMYKCPDCMAEGKMVGKGINIECKNCGATHELNEYGELIAINAEETFPTVPEWYRWEREEARKEVIEGGYRLDIPVDIFASFEPKSVWDVGSGRLIHTDEGFKLTSDDGEINYEQKPLACYSVNSDFNWYERGDIISIGNGECLYYCFPKDQTVPVAKTRLIAEEMYKIARENMPRSK